MNETELWEAIQSDPKFLAESEPVRLAERPFIVALPDILNDVLREKVTMRSFLLAKYVYVQYCLNHGLAEIAAAAIPDPQPNVPDPVKFRAQHIAAWLQRYLERTWPLILDPEKFLAHVRSTETEFLRREGLNSTSLDLFATDNLTIGRLMEIQPAVFVTFVWS